MEDSQALCVLAPGFAHSSKQQGAGTSSRPAWTGVALAPARFPQANAHRHPSVRRSVEVITAGDRRPDIRLRRTPRKEHELSSRPVGRPADVVHGIPVREQRGLDLVTLAEAQGRV